MLKNILLVGLGGGLGSILRYGSSLLIRSNSFPFSTLLVNILGSFVIGAVLAWGIKEEPLSAGWRLFLATGICGGFTTFSTFSAENLYLVEQGKYLLAFGYIMASIILGMLAAFLGYHLIIKY